MAQKTAYQSDKDVVNNTERRKEILDEPSSRWTFLGWFLVIVGTIVFIVGIFPFLAGSSNINIETGLLSALYGPVIILSGLLIIISGILCIIAGVNRRSELRLRAIQYLNHEQIILLRRIVDDPADKIREENDICEDVYGVRSDTLTRYKAKARDFSD